MWHYLSAAVALAITSLMVFPASSSAGTGVAGSTQVTTTTSFDELDEADSAREIQAFEPERRSDCSRTAEALLRACRNEEKDDFWVAYAYCLNVADEDERRECFAEAEEARHEAGALCREQFEARDDVCDLLGEAPYDPEIDADDFLSPEESAKNPNPYFPLVPGTVWVYEGGGETIEITVTEDTIEILGVECFVVKDVVREGSEVIEDTDDWFVQDQEGNVWYFGELSRDFEGGELVSLDGSWKAGIDGAKPGLVMKASPQVGDAYRQEFFLGDAEDLAEVVSITGDEHAPAASCNGDCVVTREFTPIEPGHEANKHYAPGIGLILETFPDGGREELVKFIPGNPHVASLASRNAGIVRSAFPTNLRVGVPSLGIPFQSAPVIRFDLERDIDVSADVYDLAGRKVRALASRPHRAGSHAIEWDGTDANHRRVAAGVYFVRVVAGGEAASRKLVLVQ